MEGFFPLYAPVQTQILCRHYAQHNTCDYQHYTLSLVYSPSLLYTYNTGAKLTVRDKDGYAPIHLAANYQHLYCLRLLVQLGASVAMETK